MRQILHQCDTCGFAVGGKNHINRACANSKVTCDTHQSVNTQELKIFSLKGLETFNSLMNSGYVQYMLQLLQA
jgi:hypothetical protein